MVSHAAYYITYAFDTRADALLVGCLLALLLKEELAQGLIEKTCRPPWAPLVTASIIGFSVLAGRLSEGYRLTGGQSIEPLLVAILICQLVLHSWSWPWKWLNSKPVAYLGKISYPLYLYHMLATHITTRIAARIPGLSTPMFVTLAVFVAIAMVSCSYHFVEKPFLALKTKRSAQPRAARLPFVTSPLYEESKPAAPSVT
jgi:peptidoglycan/LPS O-acetylase OafA/YrhL